MPSTIANMSETARYKRRIEKGIVVNIVKSFIDAGAVDPTGKSKTEILKEIRDILAHPYFDEDRAVVDHTEDILSRARTVRMVGEEYIACLFYALWFEHKLNEFVTSLARKAALPEKDIEMLLRETSYRAKASWVLRVFGVKPIDEGHANTITKLMDLRNSFVHYKWKLENEQTTRELKSILERIEKTVKYVQYFENKYLSRIPRRKVRKLLDQGI